MKFAKSINGYNPIEVDAYESQLVTRFESEKKEISVIVENAKKECQSLREQKKILTGNLQSVRDSVLFFSNYEEHFAKTLNDAEMNALEKLEEIIIDQETFIENVKEEIAKIDAYLIIIRQDLAKTSKEINQLVNGIVIRTEVDDQINQIDNMILGFEAENHTTEGLKNTLRNVPKKEAIRLEIPKFIPVEQPSAPRLNIERPVLDTVHMETQTVEEYAVTSSRKQSKTVLIAENDQDTSAILNAVMEREGYQVNLAADAYAVVNIIKETEPFGVIILDSLLPYIETNALIKQIRSSEKWFDVPIIVTTSEQNIASSINYLESGANDFIEKPFNPRELAARVNRLYQSLA